MVSLVILKILSHKIIAWTFRNGIKITKWKTWSHIYNTFFWWYETLWNLAGIQVRADIHCKTIHKKLAPKLPLSKNDEIRA